MDVCNRFLALPVFFHSECKKTVFLHTKNLYIARAKIPFFCTRWYTLFYYSRLAFSVVAVILVGLRTICWTTRTSQTGSPKQRGKAASLKIRKQTAGPRCHEHRGALRSSKPKGESLTRNCIRRSRWRARSGKKSRLKSASVPVFSRDQFFLTRHAKTPTFCMMVSCQKTSFLHDS